MARPLRLEFPGALWHVTSRGNERRAIVRDDHDRRRFLTMLARVVETMAWHLYAYVLMDNHYHLLVETPEPNLAEGMRQVNGVYGQGFNRRHDRVGHLFQGRYRGILVEKEPHLLELTRYIVLNPVRAGVVAVPHEYQWSSYRATAGLARVPPWLRVNQLLQLLGGDPASSQMRYREFVAEGLGPTSSPWERLVGQIFLGTEEFHHRLAEGLPTQREVPRPQRESARLGVEQVVASVAEVCGTTPSAISGGRGGSARTLVAYLGRRDCKMRLRPIGAALRADIGHVSRLARQGEALESHDRGFAEVAASVRRRLGLG
jgi:REP element-mobilizing transposase RayT